MDLKCTTGGYLRESAYIGIPTLWFLNRLKQQLKHWWFQAIFDHTSGNNNLCILSAFVRLFSVLFRFVFYLDITELFS